MCSAPGVWLDPRPKRRLPSARGKTRASPPPMMSTCREDLQASRCEVCDRLSQWECHMCLVVHVKQKRPERLSSALGTLFPPFLHSRPLRAKTRLRPQTPSASQTAPMPSFRQAQGLLLGPRDQAHRPGFDRRLGFLRAMRRFLVLRAWRAHTRRARETRRWQRAALIGAWVRRDYELFILHVVLDSWFIRTQYVCALCRLGRAARGAQ